MEDRRARVARSMRALTSVIITRKILDPALDSHNVTIFYLAAGKRRMDAKPRELVVLATRRFFAHSLPGLVATLFGVRSSVLSE
jgi:hypothetical protein